MPAVLSWELSLGLPPPLPVAICHAHIGCEWVGGFDQRTHSWQRLFSVPDVEQAHSVCWRPDGTVPLFS